MATADDPADLDWMEIRTGLQEIPGPECLALLERGGIARIGVIAGDEAMVVPVNYATDDGRVILRTGAGTKFHAMVVDRANVTIEIDHVDETYQKGWSVMAVGEAVEITDPDEIDRLRREVPLRPWAGGDKSHWIAVTPRRITGRRIG